MILEKSGEIAPERMKKLRQSENNTQLWMWLVMKVKSDVKNSIGEGNGTPLQDSWLENPMDRWAWWAAVHGVAKSRTWLSDFPFSFPFHALEKDMATHSSVLACRIPGTVEPGGLPSTGSHRVGLDWSDLAAEAAKNSIACYCWKTAWNVRSMYQGKLEVVKQEMAGWTSTF